MTLPRPLRSLACLLLAAAGLVALSGCSTTEPENDSTSPWNRPAGWQQSPINLNPYGR